LEKVSDNSVLLAIFDVQTSFLAHLAAAPRG